jgi:uncharacterized protein involved in response to NO
MKTLKTIEPYRLLFPLGVVFGLLGVSVWIAHAFLPQYAYPAAVHSQLMIGTFLFAFASGFLMTAIPKMTASFPAQNFELILACALTLINALSASLNRPGLFYFTSAFSILALVGFFVRRFLARTKAIPPFFPFVISGLLSGFFGAALLGLSPALGLDRFVHAFGRKLYFEGMTLFLVLGIGSRLMSVISGRGVTDEPGRNPVLRSLSLVVGLFTAMALESAEMTLAGGILKIVVVGWIAFFQWGLTRKSKTKSRLAAGMRVSGFMVFLGFVMAVVQPSLAVHWMHLTYVAGFGLMTLTVASRVTLAHGNHDLVFESQSRALWICGALVVSAALTRVAAPFTGSGYTMHLLYAAALWIGAMLIWGAVFLKRVFWKGTGPEGC